MNNENKKTFGDLFSSLNMNEEQDTNQKVTFDSIFEQVKEEQNSIIEPKKDSNKEEESIENNPLMEEPKEESIENNPSMEEPKEEPIENNPFMEEPKEESIENNPFMEEPKEEPTENNPFMEEPKEESIDNNPFMEEPKEETIENNPFMEEPKEEPIENNPFMEEPKEEPIENNPSMEEPKEESIDNNPFMEEPKEEPIENNPFMEEPKEEPIENNPFMEESKEESIDNNPFMEEPKEEPTPLLVENKQEEIDPNNPFIMAQNKKEENENITPKSDSPFFESGLDNEQQSPENPLLQNTVLNLMESQKFENIDSQSIDMEKSQHFNVKIVKKKEPLPKFIIGVISYAIFIWLLLIGIALLVYVLDIKIRAAKGDYSSPTYNAYVVLTGSMLPEIQVKDVVITKKIEPSKLQKGDVITFSSADSRFLGTVITHRIINKNYDAEKKLYTFQTKGDNNNVADNALVPQNNIYGKVILKIPKLGYLQEFLATDGGWIIVILIPCLVVISYDIVKLAKGLKKKKYKNIKVQK